MLSSSVLVSLSQNLSCTTSSVISSVAISAHTSTMVVAVVRFSTVYTSLNLAQIPIHPHDMPVAENAHSSQNLQGTIRL